MSSLSNFNISSILGNYSSLLYGAGGTSSSTASNSGYSNYSYPNQSYPTYSNTNSYNNSAYYGSSQNQSMGSLMASMMQMMIALMSNMGTSNSGSYDTGNSNNSGCQSKPPTSCHKPTPPASDTSCGSTDEDTSSKVLGSAGLNGDPKFQLFTPNMTNAASILKNGFESNLKAGQTVSLLKDSDNGGFEVQATGVQVDPSNTKSVGVGQSTFKSGNDTVTIKGNGDLLVNGTKKGNINDSGTIAPIKLASGLTVSTGQEVDDAAGNKKERFIISNGDYKVTAAARKPSAGSAAYLDMNFQELKADAADNATGYKTSVSGLGTQYGIADLLKMEPVSA